MTTLACHDVVFEGLQRFWQTGLFSDVEVRIGQRIFLAHKVILSAHSPVLQAMFTTDMREARMMQVKLDSVCPWAFEEMLQFMYKGVIVVTNDNVRDIMYVADQLLMRRLVKLCSDYMFKHLDISNCIDVMLVGEAHSCEDLKQAALSFICQNFSRVSLESSFVQLDLEEVVTLLNAKELPFSNEADILRAALKWISYDVTHRKKHAFNLLSTVRFKAITLRDMDYALSAIQQTNDKALAVVLASIRRDLLTGHLFRNPKFCKPKRGTSFILLFGGANLEKHGIYGSTNSLYRYDVLNKSWMELESCKYSRYKHGIGVIGDRVYLIGGHHEPCSVTSAFECYNITTGTWNTLCSTIEFRSEPMVITVNGRMYVSSADAGCELSTIIEVYDSTINTWSLYKSNIGWLPVGSNVTRCYKDKLYELVVEEDKCNIRVTCLFMESNPNSRLDMGVFGEAYYPHPPLQCAKYSSKMVFIDDHLYLIGGSSSTSLTNRHESQRTKTVHRLDLIKNKWERVASMVAPRLGHSAESVGGKIYVFGGQCFTSNSSEYCMEVYDPEMDIWELIPEPYNFTFSCSTVC